MKVFGREISLDLLVIAVIISGIFSLVFLGFAISQKSGEADVEVIENFASRMDSMKAAGSDKVSQEVLREWRRCIDSASKERARKNFSTIPGEEKIERCAVSVNTVLSDLPADIVAPQVRTLRDDTQSILHPYHEKQ